MEERNKRVDVDGCKTIKRLERDQKNIKQNTILDWKPGNGVP